MYTLEYLVYHLRPFGTTGTSHYSTTAANNTSADDVEYMHVPLPTGGQPASVAAVDGFMKSAATNVSSVGSNVLSPGRAVPYVPRNLSFHLRKQKSALFTRTHLSQPANRQTRTV